MSKPILAVAGDLHLSSTVYKSRMLDMTGDSAYGLQQIVAYCITQHVDLVLAGDVMDVRHPDSAEVLLLSNAIKAIHDNNLQVFGIQGQHDLSEPSWMEVVGAIRLTETPYNFKPEAVEPLITKVGLDYRPRGRLLEDLANIPPCDILVLHQMLKESAGFAGDEDNPNYDVALEELPRHVKLVIMGDNHNGFKAPKHTPPVYYTGSTHMRSYDEPPKKGFLVVHDDLTVTKEPLDTRPFKVYDLVSEEGFTTCLKEIRGMADNPEERGGRPAEVNKPFVVLRFDRALENVKGRVDEACGEKVFCKLMPYQTVDQIGEETDVVEGAVTLEGCLDEVVPPDEQPELNTFVREMLQADDPRMVIAQHREKFLGVTEANDADS